MENRIKEMLVGKLGIVGIVIYYLFAFALIFTPLAFIGANSFWVYLIFSALLLISGINIIANFVLWVWSFVVVIEQPIDGGTVFYFIILAIYVLLGLLPTIIQLVANLIALINSRKE